MKETAHCAGRLPCWSFRKSIRILQLKAETTAGGETHQVQETSACDGLDEQQSEEPDHASPAVGGLCVIHKTVLGWGCLGLEGRKGDAGRWFGEGLHPLLGAETGRSTQRGGANS